MPMRSPQFAIGVQVGPEVFEAALMDRPKRSCECGADHGILSTVFPILMQEGQSFEVNLCCSNKSRTPICDGLAGITPPSDQVRCDARGAICCR
jgi:hypothetical protein